MIRFLKYTLLSLSFVAFAQAEDWMQFRGPNNQGVASAQGLPDSWDDESGKNIAWKAPLPGQG
ncbi:MAG: serine/threonine protein kinase, partial [Planctomycetota bacterium]